MKKLMPGGILVIGRRESLPHGVAGIKPVSGTTAIFQKETSGMSGDSDSESHLLRGRICHKGQCYRGWRYETKNDLLATSPET